MIYDSLSLNKGGGIISAIQQSEQSGRASLCIGIGGTGIAALAQLKQEVFRQLKADDPDSPVPQYQHIQFLAIDSDKTAVESIKGTARLTSDEFFPVTMKNLAAVLSQEPKTIITQNPVMSWMEADKIFGLCSPQGAGCVRQVGRFLLLSKAGELRNVIRQKCFTALQDAIRPGLDVYVLAGLSGGTGGGSFVDTCYIVRDVLEQMGLEDHSSINGFFFLPDVFLSKKEVAYSMASVKYNSVNGYAALKELDYLMDLQGKQDWFSQNYGSFTIRTQKPPVDHCFLLSARKADGSVLQCGFDHCIHLAVDCILTGLKDVQTANYTPDIRDYWQKREQHPAGCLPDIGNRYYHVLGMSIAEVPVDQIATYLAADFYRRFEDCVGRKKVTITAEDVAQWAKEWGLKVEDLEARMIEGCKPLNLPDVDKNVMKAIGPIAANKSPEPWWTVGNAWLDQCSGKYMRNSAALNGELVSNLASGNSEASLIGKVFIELCALAQDPNYGPYYAARLLHSETDDLRTWALGVRKQAAEEAEILDRRLYAVAEAKAEASEKLTTANFININRRYMNYKQLEQDWYLAKNQQNMVLETAKMAGKFADDLADLERKFFTPLIKVLDDLDNTFKANAEWLNSDAAKGQTAYTQHILELDDVKKQLDETIEALTPGQLVGDFVKALLDAPDEWLQNDDSKVGRFISCYMQNVFREDVDRGLRDYLLPVHLHTMGAFITDTYDMATPILWCDPSFDLYDPNNVIQENLILTPADVPEAGTAARNYAGVLPWQGEDPTCVAAETSQRSCVAVLRVIGGVPLAAYRGLPGLKKCYDEAADTGVGAGLHLYAKTGRVTEDHPDVDWRTYLPEPGAAADAKTR